MSALIIALVTSICLAVVPQKITNEYGDDAGVTHAATEVIDGVIYEVIYLTGDDTNNRNIITENNKNTSGNYRYVLTADYTPSEKNGIIRFQGQKVILDLHGHTLTLNGVTGTGYGNVYLYVTSAHFEITDSSTEQTGKIVSPNVVSDTRPTTFIVSGGTIEGRIDLSAFCEMFIAGGTITRIANNSGSSVVVAPYMNATYDQNGIPIAVTSPDYLAVSTTPYAVGIYNIAYGYKWELNATQLSKLAIPTDKTYYLWARNANGWYEYLNIVYRDGQWVAA